MKTSVLLAACAAAFLAACSTPSAETAASARCDVIQPTTGSLITKRERCAPATRDAAAEGKTTVR